MYVFDVSSGTSSVIGFLGRACYSLDRDTEMLMLDEVLFIINSLLICTC